MASVKSVKDMTSGNPIKLILTFAIPMFLGNVCQQLYSVADTAIVGRGVGVNALAAVGSTGSLNWMVVGFIMGLTHGFSIKISQAFGSKDEKKTRRSIVMSLYLSMLFSAIVSVFGAVFAKQMMVLLDTPKDILNDAALYIGIIFGGTATVVLYNITSSILRSVGNSKIPLIVIVICSLLNIVLNSIFVITFKWGIAGAAIATLAANLISGVICLMCIFQIPEIKPQKGEWGWDNSLASELIKIGMPVAFMSSVTAIGALMLQRAVNGLGADVVASYTLGSKSVGITDQLLNVIGMSVAIYVGQNYGAGKMDRTRKGVRDAAIVETIFAVIITAILLTFGKQISMIFVDGSNTDVINGAVPYQVICGCMMWALGLLFIFRNSLQGMGDTVVPMYSGILELGLRLSVVFFLPASLGFLRVCFAEVSAWFGAMAMLGTAYFIRVKKVH